MKLSKAGKQAASRRKYFAQKAEKEGKVVSYKRPYADQIEQMPVGLKTCFVVWVSETYGSDYGYNRAVYPTLAGALFGARGIRKSGQYAFAADRIRIYRQEVEDAAFANRYIPDRGEFVCH